MNNVSKFLAENTKAAMLKKDVNVTYIIKDYITNRQRVKFSEVLKCVYRTIGKQYFSEEMNQYILNILNILVKEGFVKIVDNYYVLSSLL